MRNFLRFRRARHGRDRDLALRLSAWTALAAAYCLELVLGDASGSSVLRGRYEGLHVRIGFAWQEVRSVTTFTLELPRDARPELLERLAAIPYLHKKREALIADYAAHAASAPRTYRTSGPAPTEDPQTRAVGEFDVSDLLLSKRTLFASVRYLETAAQHKAVLALMVSIARWVMVDGMGQPTTS